MNEKVKREEMEAAKKDSLHASLHYMCQEWAKQWIYFQKKDSHKWQDNIFYVEVISLEWQTVQEKKNLVIAFLTLKQYTTCWA